MDDEKQILDLSDRETKRRLMQWVGTLSGAYEVLIKKVRPTRTLNQNRYYFQCFVTPWRDYLRAEWGVPWLTTEQAHYKLVEYVDGLVEKVNERTGETISFVPPTHNRDIEKFGQYMERAAEWLFVNCEIIVLSPEQYRGEPKKRKAA